MGDAMVRTALFEAANVMLTRAVRFSTLKAWALPLRAEGGGMALEPDRLYAEFSDTVWLTVAAPSLLLL